MLRYFSFFPDFTVIDFITLLISLVIVFLYNYSYYSRRLKSAKKLREDYKRYLSKLDDAPTFLEKIPEIKSLFKEAKIESPVVSEMEPVGYGYAKPTNGKVLDNLHLRRQDYADLSFQMFHRLVGYFQLELNKRLSISYWIETLVNLPKYVLRFVGISNKSWGAKLFTLIYKTALMLIFIHETYQALEWAISNVVLKQL